LSASSRLSLRTLRLQFPSQLCWQLFPKRGQERSPFALAIVSGFLSSSPVDTSAYLPFRVISPPKFGREEVGLPPQSLVSDCSGSMPRRLFSRGSPFFSSCLVLSQQKRFRRPIPQFDNVSLVKQASSHLSLAHLLLFSFSRWTLFRSLSPVPLSCRLDVPYFASTPMELLHQGIQPFSFQCFFLGLCPSFPLPLIRRLRFLGVFPKFRQATPYSLWVV